MLKKGKKRTREQYWLKHKERIKPKPKRIQIKRLLVNQNPRKLEGLETETSGSKFRTV